MFGFVPIRNGYGHLFTRSCPCGGSPELLMDFVGDFEIRCSRCHRSTHAWTRPEDAILHWNRSDDAEIILDLFTDDLKVNLRGDVTEIRVGDSGFRQTSGQSCGSKEAVLRIGDRLIGVDRCVFDEQVELTLDEIGSFNSDAYPHMICPEDGEHIVFENGLYTDTGILQGLRFRRTDGYLFVIGTENGLTLTNSAVDLSGAATDG